MKLAGPLLVLLTISACGSSEKTRQQRLMNEIEAKLKLPKGSLPLAQHARYYTEYRGRVLAAYTTEIETRAADYGCSDMQANMSLKEVSGPAAADLRPGRRRWVQFSDYPAVASEGCRAVQIQYDASTKSVEYAECAMPDY
ncbi:MAG TPA: hypothetical protein VF592_03340 [Sphingomonas sp.]|jgi:hypothetical protein|uniref:hypothetical protein n=1 Tax=Sphingomonas sp. TaxID=28214 RepID=UPI002EDB9868